MLHNKNAIPNRTAFLWGIYLLSFLTFLSYLPGFWSIVNKSYQPSLVTTNIWLDTNSQLFPTNLENIISLTAKFGWRKIYWVEGKDSIIHFDNEDGVHDNDSSDEDLEPEIYNLLKMVDINFDNTNESLYIFGLIYFVLIILSATFFLLSYGFKTCKRIKVGFIVISWIILACAIGSYLIIFQIKIVDDLFTDINNHLIKQIEKYNTINFDNTNYDITNINNVLDWQWELGFGLIGNCIGLVLLPIINIFLLV